MIARNVDIAAVAIVLVGVAFFVHVRDALHTARFTQDMIIFSKPPMRPMPELPHIPWHSD